MKNINELVEVIRNCDKCYGQGITGWVSPDGDYDFEYCDCNPSEIILDHDGEIVSVK